jgi:hypothetical protein
VTAPARPSACLTYSSIMKVMPLWTGAHCRVVVKALGSKSEGRGLETR